MERVRLRPVARAAALAAVGLGLAALGFAGGGCASGSDPAAAPTGVAEATTTASPASPDGLPVSTTSTSAPSVAADATAGVTAGVPFETEVKRAALALLAVRNDVFQHPDVARVAEYVAPTCTCLERERGFIERFVNEGLRWTAGPMDVIGINVSNPDETGPTLTVVAAQPVADLVTNDGSIVQHVDRLDDAAYSVTLITSDGGGWQINGLEGIVLDAPTTAAVIAEGIP